MVLWGPSTEITRFSNRTPPVQVFGVGVPGPLAAAGTVASTQPKHLDSPALDNGLCPNPWSGMSEIFVCKSSTDSGGSPH